MTNTPRRCHYVLSTHWDREWYQTFQAFRFRLVKLMDRVLEGWRTGELLGPMQTDGQAILLEDYLEVRPERREEIMQHAREGRLVIGPWYAMPDEFLVSGESLVRNLRLGRQVARAFGGKPSDAGFTCDIFGHNSQLPQIYAGFGIPAALIWRGVNTWDRRTLLWEGADGTVMPTYRFGRQGYCTFALEVRERGCANGGDPALFGERLDEFIAWQAECSDVDPLLLFDGCDHMEWDRIAYGEIAGRMASPERDEDPGTDPFEIVHSTLDAYLREMVAQADRIETRVSGELREPARYDELHDNQWLIPGVLSSRVWIKQENAACETLLTRYAEPLGALAHYALGAEYPSGYLDVAWRWLLKNHPHDSICGCSIDQVHEDMKFRFSQCRGIAEAVTTDAARRIVANVGEPVAEDTLRLALFNGALTPVDESVEVTLAIPEAWPTFQEFFGFERKPAFHIYDGAGAEVPYQRLAQALDQPATRLYDCGAIANGHAHHVRVSLPATIPGSGYTAYTVHPGEGPTRGAGGAGAITTRERTRHPSGPGLATTERSMENEHIAVRVESDGTLSLLDRHTGQRYERLLTFEDCADIGDGWFHGMAVNDEAWASTGASSAVALVHDGPWLTTFRVRTTLPVPAEFRSDAMVRADAFLPLVIDSLVSLRPGARHVEIETTVHNNARDHRLRVLFPSGAQTSTYLSDTPFDVVERPIALRADNHLYRELEVETKPQRSWSAVADEARGLAVISEGLMESAVRDLPERPIALTLFRATLRTVGTPGEPEGQLQGELRFRYWLTPLSGVPASAESRAALFALADRLACGVRTAQVDALDAAQWRQETVPAGTVGLPWSHGLLEVDGSVVVTSVEIRAGAANTPPALEIRGFNPGTEVVTATYRVADAITVSRAELVNLEGTALDVPAGMSPAVADGAVTVTFGPKKIVTVRMS